MKAHLRRVRLSSRKAQIVAGLIRGKKAVEAVDLLRFTPQKSAKLFLKTLKSAMANAKENKGINPENLAIKTVVANPGTSYRRYLPSARGRALPLRKPTTHITIELSEI